MSVRGPKRRQRKGLTLSIIGSVVGVLMVCAFAAAASHIFRARADSLAQPAV
jgi:hypothetical protein